MTLVHSLGKRGNCGRFSGTATAGPKKRSARLVFPAEELDNLTREWTEIDVACWKRDGRGKVLSMTTSMDAMWRAKCPKCGVVARARKARFLQEQGCPKCAAVVSFVLLPCTDPS